MKRRSPKQLRQFRAQQIRMLNRPELHRASRFPMREQRFLRLAPMFTLFPRRHFK